MVWPSPTHWVLHHLSRLPGAAMGGSNHSGQLGGLGTPIHPRFEQTKEQTPRGAWT